MESSGKASSSSFVTEKVNSSTFVVIEDDAFLEHPFIYVKLHPKAPVLILSDTGCDEPSEKSKNTRFTHLRDYLENCPVKANNNKPLNPGCKRQYIIICTHCHYDHLLGISQFLEGGTTLIIASAAGRDFIESDLEHNGLFDAVGKPKPYFKVTKWAQAFENLTISSDDGLIDLGITILQTPGHTPDELAWYDHEEMHLYVGDSAYEEGEDQMPIIWPREGNMIEWVFSLQKMLYFVRSKNAKAAAACDENGDGWVEVSRRVKLGAGHQTHSIDAEEFLDRCDKFLLRILTGKIPVAKKSVWRGDAVFLWREKDGKSEISFKAPARLMDEAYQFFKGIFY